MAPRGGIVLRQAQAERQRVSLARDGLAAQVARLGQDDVLEPLDGGGLDRRIDPLPPCATWRLAATRTASARKSRSRMETVILTRSPGLRGLAYQSVTITPPLLSDWSSGAKLTRLERGAPEVGVDADRGDLAGGEIGLGPFVAAPPQAASAASAALTATARVRRMVREVAVMLAVMLRETSSRVSLERL